MNTYTQIFVAMEMIFIVIVIILSTKMNKNIGTIGEIRHFLNIQITFIVEVFTQIFWILQSNNVIVMDVLSSWILNGTALIALAILLYEWFRFITHEVLKIEHDKMVLKVVHLQTFVVLLDAIVTISSYWTGLIYKIDSNAMYSRGNYYWIHSALCYSHWLGTTILLVYYLKKEEAKARKQLYDMLIVSLFPFFGGILCILNNQIPFLDASIMLSTLLIFINLQEEQITSDALTGLNNRSNFMKVYDRLLNSADIRPFVMFVADIDDFKKINDRYGHLAGDQALIVCANILRKIGRQYPSLHICRYGGDEFVLLASCKDIGKPDSFANFINQTLHNNIEKKALGFDVKFSIGYQVIDNKGMKLKNTFEKADKMLYEIKQEKKNCVK